MNPMEFVALTAVSLCAVVAGEVTKYTNAKFTSKLYENALANRDPQISFVFSPLSIELALLMLYQGSDGQTQEQISEHFRTNGGPNYIHNLKTSLSRLNESILATEATLTTSAYLALDDKYKVKSSYTSNIQDLFNGRKIVVLADFDRQGDKVVENINRMVARDTNQLITNLLSPGAVSSDSALVLVNALYLRSPWLTPFATRENSRFRTGLGNNIGVTMLTSAQEALYFEQNGAKVVKVALNSANLSVYFILPRDVKENPMNEISYIGTSGIIGALLNDPNKFTSHYTLIEIPKFEVEYNDDIIDDLQKMGIKDAFDASHADFSNIFDSRVTGVAVTKAQHKAFLKVNEAGIEGAAANAFVLGNRFGADPEKEFIANRPFQFYITAVHQNDKYKFESILFAGQFSGKQ